MGTLLGAHSSHRSFLTSSVSWFTDNFSGRLLFLHPLDMFYHLWFSYTFKYRGVHVHEVCSCLYRILHIGTSTSVAAVFNVNESCSQSSSTDTRLKDLKDMSSLLTLHSFFFLFQEKATCHSIQGMAFMIFWK